MDGLCASEGLQVGFEVQALPPLQEANRDPELQADRVVYPWSSPAHWVGRRLDPLVAAHESLWQLGNTPFEREVHYAEMVRDGLGLAQKKGIESSLKSGWPLGDAQFVANLQKLTRADLCLHALDVPVAHDVNPRDGLNGLASAYDSRK
jgi:hypothetical protein